MICIFFIFFIRNHDGELSFEELYIWTRESHGLFYDLDYIRDTFQLSFLGDIVSRRILERKSQFKEIEEYKKLHYGHDPPSACFSSLVSCLFSLPNPLHYDYSFNDDTIGDTIMSKCIREYLIEKYHISKSDYKKDYLNKIRPDKNSSSIKPFSVHKSHHSHKKVVLNASVASTRRSVLTTTTTSTSDDTSSSSKTESFKIKKRKSTKISISTKFISDRYVKQTLSINDLPGVLNLDAVRE